MKEVFADTGYWIGLLNSRDTLHSKARDVSQTLEDSRIITTQLVLIELLNDFSSRGPELRRIAADLPDKLNSNPVFTVVPCTDLLVRESLRLYRSRANKEWSFTDCASFVVMEDRGLTKRWRMTPILSKQVFDVFSSGREWSR